MLKQSTVMVIHQDNFLIDDTLQEIALIFAKAVLTNKDNLEELKLHTGLVRHYMANNMSWERGAASIGELVEGSVYGSVDLEATYDKEQQIDLAALTSPLLSLFMKAYESMIHLKPIIANSGL